MAIAPHGCPRIYCRRSAISSAHTPTSGWTSLEESSSTRTGPAEEAASPPLPTTLDWYLVLRRRGRLLRLLLLRLLRLLTIWRRLVRVVGHVLALKDQLDGRAKLLVVGVAHDLADVHILRHIPAAAGEVQFRIRLGINREPILPIHLLAVGRKGWRQILVPLAHVIGHIFGARNHNLQILLVYPD